MDEHNIASDMSKDVKEQVEACSQAADGRPPVVVTPEKAPR